VINTFPDNLNLFSLYEYLNTSGLCAEHSPR
ncbi:unnamed protein product, partial [marine sediment metagenome]